MRVIHTVLSAIILRVIAGLSVHPRRSSNGNTSSKVDVLFSADRRNADGLITAVTSVLETVSDPARLRINIAVEPQDLEFFKDSLHTSSGNASALIGGASLIFHTLDLKTLHSLYPSHGALREDGPSNYARFFADSYLPGDAERCIWLDADVLVQHDILELADSLLSNPSKTIAFTQYPGSAWGFDGSLTIGATMINRTWSTAHLDDSVLRHPLWNVGVLAINLHHLRSHELRDRTIRWMKVNDQVQLYKEGGSQTPLDLAALVHDGEQPFFEVDSTWNCWWGFLGALRNDQLDTCKILHFAGARKPWNAGTAVTGFERWQAMKRRSNALFGKNEISSSPR